ncbi:hypothetical protein LTS18_000129, partial [Coniosporium uncinatum]
MSLSWSTTEDEHSDVQDTTPNQEEGPTELDLDLSGVSFSIIDIFNRAPTAKATTVYPEPHHSPTSSAPQKLRPTAANPL